MAIFGTLQEAELVSMPQNRHRINGSKKRVQTSRLTSFQVGGSKKPSFRFQVNFDSWKCVSFE
jgi:hypothetical protein